MGPCPCVFLSLWLFPGDPLVTCAGRSRPRWPPPLPPPLVSSVWPSETGNLGGGEGKGKGCILSLDFHCTCAGWQGFSRPGIFLVCFAGKESPPNLPISPFDPKKRAISVFCFLRESPGTKVNKEATCREMGVGLIAYIFPLRAQYRSASLVRISLNKRQTL